MIVFPLAAALIALATALYALRRYLARGRAHELVWTAAFGLFALAAGLEVIGSLAGWTPLLARLYYLSGATLVVGYLALGTIYLLFPRPAAHLSLAVLAALSVLAVGLAFRRPVNEALLATEGWRAPDRGGLLLVLTIFLNTAGTIILVGGALFSAWQLFRRRLMPQRVLGLVLIAAGALVVAAGGTLTRLGAHEYLYIAMAVGVALIFIGYVQANVPAPGKPA